MGSARRRSVIDVDMSTYPARFRILFRSFTGLGVEPVDRRTRVTIRFEVDPRRVLGVARVSGKLAQRSATEIDSILESYTIEVV